MVNEPTENTQPYSPQNRLNAGSGPDYSGGAALPFVLLDRDGKVTDVGLMNEKGFRKSIERGTLWVVNAETGRLLPYREGTSFTGLAKAERWYTAVLREGPDAGTPADTAAPADKTGAPSIESGPVPYTDAEPAESAAAAGSIPGAGDSAMSTGETQETRAVAGASVLLELADLLKTRKTELPEGSYTAHLFRSGPDKIRKKTGEEAVELILARTRDEVIYESADLLYHLLVLLTALEIEVNEVFAELGTRH